MSLPSAAQVLAAVPAAAVTADTIAPLTAATVPDAARELHELVRQGRATEPAPGSFQSTEADTVDRPVLEQVLDAVLTRAAACCYATNPHRPYHGPALTPMVGRPPELGADQARTWMEEAFEVLAAAVRAAHDQGLHSQCWQLVETLKSELTRSRHTGTRLDLAELGQASAHACQDKAAEAVMGLMVAQAHLAAHDYGQALHAATHAQQLAAEAGHAASQASSWEAIGLAHHGAGRLDEATRAHRAAITAHQELGDERGVALIHRNLGRTLTAAGDPTAALDAYDQAQTGLEQAGDLYLLGRVHAGRAQALLALGRQHLDQTGAQALMAALDAVRAAGQTRSAHIEAEACVALADHASLTGQGTVQERVLLERALVLYQGVQAPEADQVRERVQSLTATAPAGR